jgi:hypothetical protein
LQQAVSEAVDCHVILRRVQEAVRNSLDLDVCVQEVVASIPPDVLEAADSTLEQSEPYIRAGDPPELTPQERFVYFASLHEACKRDEVYRFLHFRGGTIACMTLWQLAKTALEREDWDQAGWAGLRMTGIGVEIQQVWLATHGSIFYGLALHGKGSNEALLVLRLTLEGLEGAARDAPDAQSLEFLKHWAAIALDAYQKELDHQRLE